MVQYFLDYLFYYCNRMDIKPVSASTPDHYPLSLKLVESKSRLDVNQVSVGENMETLEEDETRMDSKDMPSLFYRDPVPSLTDENFNVSLKEKRLSAVLFYVGFDSVSTILKPVFAKVHEMLGTLFTLTSQQQIICTGGCLQILKISIVSDCLLDGQHILFCK